MNDKTIKKSLNVNKKENSKNDKLNISYLKIQNYKNLNFNCENEHENKILLNSSLSESNSNGDLFFIIGLNNVGKSNVLSALKILGKEKKFIPKEDSPFFSYDLEKGADYTTKISIEEYGKGKKQRSIIGSKPNPETTNENNDNFFEIYSTDETILDKFNENYGELDIKAKINYFSDEYRYCSYCGMYYFYSVNKQEHNHPIRVPIGNGFHDRYENNNYYSNNNHYPNDDNILFIEIDSKNKINTYELLSRQLKSEDNDILKINNNYYKLFLKCTILAHKQVENKIFILLKTDEKMNNFIKIKSFEYTKYKNENFHENWGSITQENTFLFKLFSMLGIEARKLQDIHKNIQDTKSQRNRYKKIEKIINDKLDKLSEEFNQILISSNSSYKFTSYVSESLIELCFEEDGNSINFEFQSEGFKWFFSFFMWMKMNEGLNNGDIVLIDEEFGNNITPKSVMELRKKLKEFSYKSGISFVISTHNPFLMDLNYLEEIRVVQKLENNSSIIKDKFHTIYENHDTSLKPLLETFSLTSNVFYDKEKTKTYFVEGITDYCYLTAMSIKLNIKNLLFLPIQGLSNQDINIYKQLEKNPRFLIDGDQAGEKFYKKNSLDKSVTIFKLSDINEDFVTIENLFEEEWKNNILNSKSFAMSVAIKKAIINEDIIISDKTKKNFNDLFDKLLLS
ncbi:ATP-binding protein [Mycoplasma zalophi]|uniref:ATP-binding protein n=1 Tax=Mycoplasma zalophi TaxID=191287 RepID=A0ABS6DP67_9MOLU|nr:ATP-binding protein [Mycoplasma zalophi]MBU4692116.1 ATP-binding protein [Mycoplasma zalophi]